MVRMWEVCEASSRASRVVKVLREKFGYSAPTLDVGLQFSEFDLRHCTTEAITSGTLY